MCNLVSCSPSQGTRNWGSLSSQFWRRARLTITQSLLTHYQRAKHLEGLFQYNHRAPQGSLCQKSDSHVVCRLQKYIPEYTPFQKPTLSKASVLPTYLLSQLFLPNTCLRKTERTRKPAVRKQRSVFLSRKVEKLPKCTSVESNSLHRREEATAILRQHSHPFPHTLSSHTPCTDGSTGRNHWQYTLTENSCQIQHGSALMQGHRRTTHRRKSFKMHCTSSPSSQFYYFHCQYKNKWEKQMSTHRNSPI